MECFKKIYPHGIFLTVCILLWIGDYPKPTVDDSAFIDAPINMVLHGKNEAPSLVRILEPYGSKRFDIQMPIYPYVLAGWFKLFGVSSNSLLGYHAFFNFIYGMCFFQFLVLFGVGRILGIFMVLVSITLLLLNGARPELLSYVAIFGGGILLNKDRLITYFWGYFLIGLSVLLSPSVLPLSCAIGFIVPFKNYLICSQEWTMAKIFKIVLVVFLAAGMLFILFLFTINLQLSSFLEPFMRNAKSRPIALTFKGFYYYIKWITEYWEFVKTFPIFIGAVGGAIIFIRRKYRNYAEPLNILVFALIILMPVQMYFRPFHVMNGFYNWMVLFLVVFSFQHTKWRRWFFICFLVSLYGLHMHWLILYEIKSEKLDPEHLEEIRIKVENTDKTVVLDIYTLRYALDYQVPKGSIAFMYVSPLPGHEPAAEKIKREEVWFMSEYRAGYYLRELYTNIPKATVLGRQLGSLPLRPYRIVTYEL